MQSWKSVFYDVTRGHGYNACSQNTPALSLSVPPFQHVEATTKHQFWAKSKCFLLQPVNGELNGLFVIINYVKVLHWEVEWMKNKDVKYRYDMGPSVEIL